MAPKKKNQLKFKGKTFIKNSIKNPQNQGDF
jgi:hypothetical protein